MYWPNYWEMIRALLNYQFQNQTFEFIEYGTLTKIVICGKDNSGIERSHSLFMILVNGWMKFRAVRTRISIMSNIISLTFLCSGADERTPAVVDRHKPRRTSDDDASSAYWYFKEPCNLQANMRQWKGVNRWYNICLLHLYSVSEIVENNLIQKA